MNARAFIVAAALVGCVVAANVVTSHYGLVAAGFGLLVPAGTYAAGLTLGLRDVLHRAAGDRWRAWVLGSIAGGAVVSFALADGRIALASGVAFLLAELADLGVYAPLVERRWWAAVALSNLVGAVVDTLLFLPISGLGVTWQAAAGQVLVKAVWMTLLVLPLFALARRPRVAVP